MDQYRITPRASFLDYDSGDYFITVCTKEKKHFFGEIANGVMCFSPIGAFTDEQLRKVNVFCPNIEIPVFVVMPNHIHAIVCMDVESIYDGNEQRSPNPSLRVNLTCQRHVPTLSRYVSSLKGAVTKYAKTLGLEFAWQSRYYDHLIRGNADRNNICEYIDNNVARWQTDCFYM